jgi:tRNA pseudouridine32 synthase / 23S rRNA pseudouridine746 synthase
MGGECLEDYFGALRFGLPRAPALAHRLDRDTSGCLVLGRHRKALAALGKLFKTGAIDKTYWALVEGGPDADQGEIALPLGRLDVSRGWWMKHDPAGQPAVTKWQVMGRSSPGTNSVASSLVGEADEQSEAGGGSLVGALKYPPPHTRAEARHTTAQSARQLAWLALEPLTGRTHQLRVHCAAMGWPILGDAIYGNAPRQGGTKNRQMLHLHARDIVAPLYKNRPPVRVTAPVPEHMRTALARCGWRDKEDGESLLPRETAEVDNPREGGRGTTSS